MGHWIKSCPTNEDPSFDKPGAMASAASFGRDNGPLMTNSSAVPGVSQMTSATSTGSLPASLTGGSTGVTNLHAAKKRRLNEMSGGRPTS